MSTGQAAPSPTPPASPTVRAIRITRVARRLTGSAVTGLSHGAFRAAGRATGSVANVRSCHLNGPGGQLPQIAGLGWGQQERRRPGGRLCGGTPATQGTGCPEAWLADCRLFSRAGARHPARRRTSPRTRRWPSRALAQSLCVRRGAPSASGAASCAATGREGAQSAVTSAFAPRRPRQPRPRPCGCHPARQGDGPRPARCGATGPRPENV